jgi:hypothetical protein
MMMLLLVSRGKASFDDKDVIDTDSNATAVVRSSDLFETESEAQKHYQNLCLGYAHELQQQAQFYLNEAGLYQGLTMNTNWKQRYDELAKYTQEIIESARKQELTFQRALNHIQYSDKLDLQDRNKARYLCLTQDITLNEVYEGYEGLQRTFPKGTLIDAVVQGNQATVYLDNDGDGFLYFPANFLEVVEVDRFSEEIDWSKVVHQG